MKFAIQAVFLVASIGSCIAGRTENAIPSGKNLTQAAFEGQLVTHFDPSVSICNLAGGVFWVENAHLRWIPNPPTLTSVFGATGITTAHLAGSACGDALTSGAILAKAVNNPAIYLVSNNVKRHISNPSVKSFYHLNGPFHSVPGILLDFIATGPSIGQ